MTLDFDDHEAIDDLVGAILKGQPDHAFDALARLTRYLPAGDEIAERIATARRRVR